MEFVTLSNTGNVEGHIRMCNNKESHVAHCMGHYSTVRYGKLDYICLGSNGKIVSNGSPDYPTIVKIEPAINGK